MTPGMGRKELGNLGERAAAEYLRRLGYLIRETNYRCPEGEVDLVAEKEGCLVFVEVRTKGSRAFGTPEESVTRRKREKLARTALYYTTTHPATPASWRVDLVAVEVGRGGRVERIELIEDALA